MADMKDDKSLVHPTAIIDPSAKIGRGTRVWAFAQIRENVVIGENTVIGNGVYIDSGVHIGNRCNIHNKALLYSNLKIEDDVFIGPHVSFINDPMPRANRKRNLEGLTSEVKEGASVGASAVIMPEVTLGKYCVVAAGAVVTRKVPDFGLVKGMPARIAGYVDPEGGPSTSQEYIG